MKKIGIAVVALAGVAAGCAGIVGGHASSAAFSCPSALTSACAPVDLVVGTVCYSSIPATPTIGPVTLRLEGRLANCPDL